MPAAIQIRLAASVFLDSPSDNVAVTVAVGRVGGAAAPNVTNQLQMC
jgi:hypothetical protein